MREKLIELLYHSGDECDQLCRTPQKGCHVCEYVECGAKCINVMEADYLIANGVLIREKGEWIPASNKPNTHIGMKCSRCHARITYSEFYNGNHNYCHKCGADMKGEEHETD